MATSKRILCDTNILLDLFDAARPAHADAVALLWYAAENPEDVQLLSPISSFKDAYYVLCRLYKDETLARERVSDVMGALVVPVDLLASYGAEALAADEPDFEDALVGACARHERAYAIVTGDRKAFAKCPVPAMNAADLLSQEGFDYETIDW